MFSNWKRTTTLLQDAKELCARQQRAIDQLEQENLQLIGQAYPLSASTKPPLQRMRECTMTEACEVRRTEVYTQCKACGCQAMTVFDSGDKWLSRPLAICGRCNGWHVAVVSQPAGTGAPSWWKPEDVPAGTGNQELYDMRLLCADQAHELRVKDVEILSLKSKVGWLETQVDRLRPAPIRPVDAVSVTVKAEG